MRVGASGREWILDYVYEYTDSPHEVERGYQHHANSRVKNNRCDYTENLAALDGAGYHPRPMAGKKTTKKAPSKKVTLKKEPAKYGSWKPGQAPEGVDVGMALKALWDLAASGCTEQAVEAAKSAGLTNQKRDLETWLRCAYGHWSMYSLPSD